MNTVAEFSYVSETICALRPPLPKRATEGAAGYDFFAPETIVLESGRETVVQTGIRARIDDGWALFLFPRSGLGFKHRLQLNNTVGIVDSDYYNAENEGHILIKLHNGSDHTVTIEKGKAFAQGIFLPYGLAAGDDAHEKRIGGFGSTDK